MPSFFEEVSEVEMSCGYSSWVVEGFQIVDSVWRGSL